MSARPGPHPEGTLVIDPQQELLAARARITQLEEWLADAESAASQLESYAADFRRTYGELRRHLQYMTVLHEVNTRIASALDPDEVMAIVLDSLGQIVSYTRAAIYLLDLGVAADDGGSRAVVAAGLPRLRAERAADGSVCDPYADGTPATEDGAVARAMQAQQTLSVATHDGTVALAVPLRAGGRALGALQVTNTHPLTDEDVKLVELLAAGAAVALQNAYLYQETQRLATTDALTGLSNYRHFHDLLRLEVERSRRMGYPIGLLMMDLDHFKQVNDRLGHPTGDVALRRVADVLRSRLRRTDVVGRLGGEEFAAVLPGASLAEVAIVAEKVRIAVQELPPLEGSEDGQRVQLTISVGGTSATSGGGSVEELVDHADRALFVAKRSGRNRVVLWDEQVQGETAPGDGYAELRRAWKAS